MDLSMDLLCAQVFMVESFHGFCDLGPVSARMGTFAIFSRFLGPPSGRTFWCMGLSSPACVWAA